MKKHGNAELITRYADMLSALGTEPRLRIVRLLLSAYPQGLVFRDIGSALAIPPSLVSPHLEKLIHADLVKVRRKGAFRRYSPNTGTLHDLLAFLHAECCTRNHAIEPQQILCGAELLR